MSSAGKRPWRAVVSPVVAAAAMTVALKEVELVLLNHEHVGNLMHGYPGFVLDLLREANNVSD